MTDVVIGSFNDSGENTVSIEKTIKRWNHLWCLIQWEEKFTLVKYLRKDSPITVLKTQISDTQARQLIDVLSLKRTQGFMSSSACWRKDEHSI